MIREHRFADLSSVRVRGGSRAESMREFDELGAGLGRTWVEHVDAYADDWEVLRRHYFEVPWQPDALPREVAARLSSRETLHKRLRRTFRDERLAMVAAHPFVAEGHDPRNVPAWAGLRSYLEQSFGAWRVPAALGGMARLTEALEKRMATRRVTVLTGTPVLDLVVRQGRVAAVRTDGGRAPRRRRGLRDRPAPAARAGGPRRPHHAGDPAGRHPPRSRRRAARPAARAGAPRRPAARRPHRWPRTRGPRRLDPARTGQAGRGHAPRPGPARPRRARPGRRPASTAPRATWSSAGAARRTACCGRAARPCATAWAPPPRSPGSTPPAPTPPPEPVSPTSVSRPPWSPSASAPPDPRPATR